MASYLSGIPSPISERNSYNKSSVGMKTNKRITILLSDCESFQSSLASTMKNMNKSSSDTQKYFKIIKKQIKQEPKSYKFKEEYDKAKLVLEKGKKNSAQLTEFQIKIESLLKNSKNNEKFELKRAKCRQIKKKAANEFIGLEELRNPEALKILKSNKRRFGEGFERKVSNFRVEGGKLNGYTGVKMNKEKFVVGLGNRKNFGLKSEKNLPYGKVADMKFAKE